jgi:hypothetical protein
LLQEINGCARESAPKDISDASTQTQHRLRSVFEVAKSCEIVIAVSIEYEAIEGAHDMDSVEMVNADALLTPDSNFIAADDVENSLSDVDFATTQDRHIDHFL